MSKKKNFQIATVHRRCLIPLDSNETECVGYRHGSHGNCDFRGTGSAFQECNNLIILGGVIKI